MAKTNDLKTLHEAVVGRTIPMEMDFDPKELSDQYAHTPYVNEFVPTVDELDGVAADFVQQSEDEEGEE